MAYAVRFASTPADLDAAYALRHAVFSLEHGVPRPLDRDALDLNAAHVVAYDESGACVGTGRIARMDARVCRIGRLAVAREHRQHGVGAEILELLEHMGRLRGFTEMTVQAHFAAERFFQRRGFVTEGDVFLDSGLPHLMMRKLLLARAAAA